MTRRITPPPLLQAFFLSLVLLNSASGQDAKKTAYVVLLDNTGSMRTQFSQVVVIGKEAVHRICRQGPVAIFNFKTQDDYAVADPGMAWTQDETALNAYIERLRVVTGHTVLFEAVDSMVDELNAKVNSDKVNFGEKVLILITDGDDRIRRATNRNLAVEDEDDAERRVRDRLIKKLKESGIKVLIVGLTRELAADSLTRMSQREKAETMLRKIAKETGGRVVFPKAKVIEIDKLLNEVFGP